MSPFRRSVAPAPSCSVGPATWRDRLRARWIVRGEQFASVLLDFIVGLGAVVSAVVTLCVTLTGLGMVTCVLLLPFAPDVVIQVFGWVLPCYVLSGIAMLVSDVD